MSRTEETISPGVGAAVVDGDVLVIAVAGERGRLERLVRDLETRPARAEDAPLVRERDGVEREADATARAIRLAVEQHRELVRLRTCAEQRALTERAKGVLMARHRIDEEHAFQLLRRHARNTNRRIVDVAAAVLEAHTLFAEPAEAVVD